LGPNDKTQGRAYGFTGCYELSGVTNSALIYRFDARAAAVVVFARKARIGACPDARRVRYLSAWLVP
jgi:hypothetical protein